MGWGLNPYKAVAGGIGTLLNNATGATSAAKQSQRYALQSAAVNNQYQKEFAKNAHQWEVADLEAAGLNPVLSAGGSGTGASGGGVNSASQQSAGIDPFTTAVGAWQGIENALNTGADKKRLEAETENVKADTILKGAETLLRTAETSNTYATRKLALANAQKVLSMLPKEIENIISSTELNKAQKKKTIKEKEKMTTRKGGTINIPNMHFGLDGISLGGNLGFGGEW